MIEKFCKEVTHHSQLFDFEMFEDVLLYFSEESSEYKKNTKRRKRIVLEMDEMIH